MLYRHTCPLIDDGIDEIKKALDLIISDILYECGSSTYNDQNYLDSKVEEYYIQHFDELVEKLRETNSDLRSSAETVIEDLKGDHKIEIDELEEKIETLNQKIDELESEVYHLENKN